MELSTSTWMMIAFIAGMILSIWKMYPFLINRTVEDDDRGEDTHQLLVDIMHKVLKEFDDAPSLNELHDAMKADEAFDKKKLWRFNPNKLNQLLNRHYAENEDLNTIEDIHKKVHSK